MDFRLTPQEEAFRQEVRDWLRENLPEDWSGDRFTRDRVVDLLRVREQFESLTAQA